MLKNPWLTLVIGLMVGLGLGYALAERQPIPPGKALRLGAPSQAQGMAGLPEGHPPVDQAAAGNEVRVFEQQIAEIRGLLAQSPDDAGLMVSLGDSYFELARATSSAEHWNEARAWYDKAMASGRGDDPNVMTDLAVVYRSLGQPERSLELVDRAIAVDPDHWQAWFNKVIILHFDLHEHDAARDALGRLKAIAAENPQVPDLTRIEQEVMGS
jgi:tetratricopeptide (TPR) repeat protein